MVQDGCNLKVTDYISVGGWAPGVLTQKGGHITCGETPGTAPFYIGFNPSQILGYPRTNTDSSNVSTYTITGTSYGNDPDDEDCSLITEALLIGPTTKVLYTDPHEMQSGYAKLEVGSDLDGEGPDRVTAGIATIHVMGVSSDRYYDYTASVSFGPNSSFTVTDDPGDGEEEPEILSSCTITLWDSAAVFEIQEGPDGSDLSGLEDLTLVCSFVDNSTLEANDCSVEAAGAYEDIGSVQTSDFNTGNFVIDKLVIGNEDAAAGSGKVTLTVTDDYDNQDDGTTDTECLYVNTLEMAPGGTFDTTGSPIYYLNGLLPKQLIMADANLDGAVSLADLTILATYYDDEGTGIWEHADFNGDRNVSLSDLTILATYYGSGTSTKGSGVTVTVSTSSQATPNMSGYSTFTVTIEVDTDVIDGFALEFSGNEINQENPFGAATVFTNNNFAFDYVPEEVAQDSQFKFNTGDLVLCPWNKD